ALSNSDRRRERWELTIITKCAGPTGHNSQSVEALMRFVKWLIGIVVVVSILLTAVPLVTKWYVVRWLESKGYQAEIKKLGMNFIFGEMTLQGVSIASPQGERFDIFDGSVNFDFWRLKDRRLVIDRVKGDSLKLDVRNSRDGVTVAGFPLDPIFSRFGKGIPLEIR